MNTFCWLVISLQTCRAELCVTAKICYRLAHGMWYQTEWCKMRCLLIDGGRYSFRCCEASFELVESWWWQVESTFSPVLAVVLELISVHHNHCKVNVSMLVRRSMQTRRSSSKFGEVPWYLYHIRLGLCPHVFMPTLFALLCPDMHTPSIYF